jgi:MFS family permease
MPYGSEVSWRSDLGALHERDFRLLFIGRSFSAFGDALGPIAITFAVLDLGGAGDLGFVLGAQALGLTVFVLVAGVWADRVSRRRLVLIADVLRLVAQAVTAALVLAGAAEIWMLAVLAFVFGTGEAIFMPASSALIPETVSAVRLQPANALLGMSRAATMIAGPAVGGVLVAGAGPGAALVVHAATYAVSAAFLLPMHARRAPAGERTGFLRELREGYREVRCRRWLWASIAGFAAFSVMAFPAYMIAGPVIAKDELGGPGAWAVILTAGSVGALLGSVVALRFRPRRPMLVCWLLCLVEPPQLVLLGLAGPVPAIAFLAFLGGITFPMFETLWTTAIQRNVPPDALGRVTSYDWFGSLVTAPLGYALAGPLVAVVGASGVLYVAAAAIVVIPLAVIAVPEVRGLQSSDRVVVG